MANLRRVVDYEIQFRTNQLSLQNVARTFEKMLDSKTIFKDLQIINNSTKELARKDFLEMLQDAKKVQEALTAAFNPKLGITNIDAFKSNLSQVGLSVLKVKESFDRAGTSGATAFLAMTNSLTNVRLKATESASILDKMGETLKRTLTWSVSSSIINKMAGSIQEAYGYVKHLDSSLNDIRIVTEYSAEAMDKFAEKANKAAITLGKSTTDYTEAALIYYQQGLGEKDVAARTNVTLKTANVTQQSTALVSEELTAIWNGYKVNAEEAEAYIDKVAKVAAVTAADLEEMATGMSKVASAANVMGVDIDLMNAILATTISVTRQAPESVGAAYKTIFARMSLIQAGEETDDGATLKSYTEQMDAMGVSVLDANDHLRDMGDIIEEVGGKWLTWSREQQIAFALVAAGTRLYNNLIALFDNWGMYEKTLEESKNALGTLLTQQDIYMESTAAHLQQLRTAAEGVYDSLLNAKDINGVVDVFTQWAKGAETIVDSLGGLRGILTALAPIMISVFSADIGKVAGLMFNNLNIGQENLARLLQLNHTLDEIKGKTPEVTEKYILMKEALLGIAKYMSPDQYNALAQLIENLAKVESEVAARTLERVLAEKLVATNLEEQNNIRQQIVDKEKELNHYNDETYEFEVGIEDCLNRIKKKQEEINSLSDEYLKINGYETIQAEEKKIESYKEEYQKLIDLRDAAMAYKAALATTPSGSPARTNTRKDFEEALAKSGRYYDTTGIPNSSKNSVIADKVLQESPGLTSYYSELIKESLTIINNIYQQQKAITDLIALKLQEILKILQEQVDLATQGVLPEEKKKELEEKRATLEAEINDLTLKNDELIEKGDELQSNLTDKVAEENRIRAELLKTMQANNELSSAAVNILFLGITKMAAGLTGITSTIKSVLNLVRVLKDDSLSTSEKLIQVLSSGAMALTSLMMTVRTLKSGYTALKGSIDAITTAKTLSIIATNGLTEAEIRKIIADQGATIATSALTAATYEEVKAMLLAKATFFGFIGLVAAVVAVTATYTAYVLSGAKAENDLKKATEKANKAYLELKEILLEVKEKQENLNNLIDTYKELKKALDDLVKGTEEWNELMENLSVTVDKLLEEYPELIAYGAVTYDPTSGSYVVNQEKMEEFLKKLESSVLQELINTNKALYEEALRLIEYYSLLSKKLAGYEEELQKWKDKEISTRLILVEELNRQAHSDVKYDNYEDYLLDSLNTMRREGLKAGLSKDDYIKELLGWAITYKQFYDENGQLRKGKSAENFANEYDYNRRNISIGENGTISYQDKLYGWLTSTIEEFVERYDADLSAYSEATSLGAKEIKEAIDNGITSLESLPNNLIEKLEKEYPEYAGKSQEIRNSYEALLKTQSLRETFNKIIDKYGWQNSNDLSTFVLNIQNAEATEGKQGLLKLEEAINQSGSIIVNVDFDLKLVEDNLLLKLDDAKIELNVFNDKKALLEALGLGNIDDDTIIRILTSLKALNDLYKERDTLLKSLSSFKEKGTFDWQIATNLQVANARALADALGARFGKEVDFDFIVLHLDIIEEYLLGSKTAAKELNLALNALPNIDTSIFNDIKSVFDNWHISAKNGENIENGLQSAVLEITKNVELTDRLIENIYNNFGYRKTKDGWVYDEKLYLVYQYEVGTDEYSKALLEYMKEGERAYLQALTEGYEKTKEEWANENGYILNTSGGISIPGTVTLLTDIQAEVEYLNIANEAFNEALKEGIEPYQYYKVVERILKALGGPESEGFLKLKESGYLTELYHKYQYINEIGVSEYFENDGTSNKLYSMSTTNHELITPETPKLDTTDSDNKLKLLKQDIQDYKDVLSSLIPGTEAYADAEERLNKANDDYLKTIDEKIAKTKDYIATNKAAATASVEAATGVKVQFGENGLVTNWEDIKKAVGDSTGYNAAAAEHAAAKEALNAAFDEEGNLKAGYDFEALSKAEKTADEKAKLAKLNYDAEIKGLQESVKWLEEVDKATSTLTDLERERNKVIKDAASYYGKLAEDAAKMTGEQKAKYDDLTYSIEKTNQALEKLGDADAFSGQNLVDYYNTYNDLVNQNTENLKALNIALEENNKAREDLINGLLRYAGIEDIKFEKRDDGTYNTSALENQLRTRIGELLNEGTVEATTEAEKLLGVLDSILKIAGGINDNIETANNNTDKINKNVSETARAAASMTFAKVNKELDDITRKLDLAKTKVEDAKTIFDKSGGMGSLSAFDDWKREYNDYLNWLDLQGDKYREKINTLFNQTYVLDILKGADGENIFNLFNAETRDDFLNGYYAYADSLDTIKEKIKKKMEDLDEEIKNAAPGQDMSQQQELLSQLTVAFEILADAEEYVTQRKKEYIDLKIDTKEVLNLKKEWLTAAIDRLIKAVNRELSLLLKLQSRLKGKDVITNLQQQVGVIQKLITLEQRKLGVLLSEAKIQQSIIQGMIARMGISGAIFDANGDINAAFLDKIAKSAHVTNEEFQILLGLLKNYKSLMSEIEGQQDAIVSLQDEIADKQYEISEKIYEETRKEAEKFLNKFKIEIEVELNEAEMMRKIDRLRAKVAAMPAWDLAGAMGLDIGDAVSYATKDVDILTNAVNKLITDYQSDAWKDFYDTLKDAYDDIISYANQLTSAVESFYDALDTARLKYSEAIDKVISANQELIDDLEEMKKISKHGINITKMLFGENSYEDLTTYYKKIQNTTREQLQAAKEQAAYYKALLATIDPMKHPDEYESVKSALKSAIDETYAYAEEMGNQALEEMNAKIEDAARKLKDEFARVLGYENSTMQDLAHDYQLKILNDYLDTTESLYEMVTLLNKFTKAINDTTSASEKSKLSKVMKEQVGYLQQLVEKAGRLTKYEVDRANMMYDLTLKLMALEEARDNKTKMRLRRDSQGNYRYEYVADAEKTAEAQQDLLELQYKIYELDKKRLLELYDEKEKLIEEFNLKLIEILNNQYLTEAEKELAVNELKEQYYGEDGYLIQLGRDYAEAVHNIDESADGELDKILEDIIEETGRTSEEIQNNFMDVANAMDDFANEGLAALDLYTTDVLDALALLTDGLGDLEATIDMDINTIMELADVDLELIDVWMELVDVCGDLMAQLEELEEYYRGVMLAALDAAEAAAKLKVTDFSTADERKKDALTGNAAAQGATNGSSATSGSASSKAGGSKDKKATILTEVLYLDGVPIHMTRPELSDMAGTGKWSQDGYNALYSKHPELLGLTQSPDLSGPIEGYKQYGKLTKKKITLKFDTGGYTGEWGTDGRLAMLHLKELVLNEKDTENFLKAADVMRTLQSNIEQILNYANTMSPSFNISAPSSDLNQNVKIEASFPGVTNSREIEDAFNNLVNLASQRAMSTRR